MTRIQHALYRNWRRSAPERRGRIRRRLPRLLVLPLLLILPAVTHGDTATAAPRVVVIDVELGPQGEWSGQIVTPEGTPVAGHMALLSNGRGTLVTTTTSRDGRFAFAQLPTGVHHLACDNSRFTVRLWKHGTAPPKAGRATLLVAHGNLVRGVQGSRIYDWASDHPVITYTGIAAAIVVPIVIAGSNQSETPATP